MSEYLSVALDAALQAGRLLVRAQTRPAAVNEVHPNDLKLAVDVGCQSLITDILRNAFPTHAVLGEEGTAGPADAEFQWIVDPLDGTVNYFYGIPHFGVSIALRHHQQVITGVIHDPMMKETWTVTDSDLPALNGRHIHVSDRSALGDAIVSVGFAKRPGAIDHSIQRYARIAPAVRKIRMLGSAALEMAYVATGRLDAYIEEQVSIWDVAAGRLLVERAGGSVDLMPHPDRPDRFSILCTNGRVPIRALLS
jgi:myo-inositol-1(or 4)-monophosphatase